MSRDRRTNLRLALAALAILPMLIAACGDDDNGDTGSGTDLVRANVSCTDLGVAAPERIKSAGKLIVASDLSYAPMEFVIEGTNEAIGADIDLARCLAQAWGVTLEVQNTSFDAIIPALTSKKADVIMSSMSVTDERKQQVDFVEYLVAGSGILVKKATPKKSKPSPTSAAKKSPSRSAPSKSTKPKNKTPSAARKSKSPPSSRTPTPSRPSPPAALMPPSWTTP